MTIREERLKRLVKSIEKVQVNNYAFYTNTLNLRYQKRRNIMLTNCSKFLKLNSNENDEKAIIEDFDRNRPKVS